MEINGSFQKFPKSYPNNLEYKVPNQLKSQLLTIANTYPKLTEAYNFTINSLAELEYLTHPLDLFQQYERRENPIQSTLEILYTGLLSLGFPSYRYNVYQHRYYGKKRGELSLNFDDNRELSRQIGIYGIFRTIFLKRLESSLHSVHLSVSNYEHKLIDFKTTLEKYGKIVSVKNLAKLNKAIDTYNEQTASEDELDFDIDSFEKEDDEFISIQADSGIFNIVQLKADIDKDLAIVS